MSKWYACRTRSRAEKKVDRFLIRAGIESYLPVIELENRWADRWKRVRVPLFSGYVFARFDLSDLGDVVRTPGLATVIFFNDHPTPIRDEEIASVRRMVEGVNSTGRRPTVVDYLQPGDEVEVVGGPFQGMRGVLVQAGGRSCVVVRVSAIRWAVGVEMERRYLRPAGGRTPA